MNERIRELHREAEKWVADNFSTDELNPYEWWEKEEQKFAELIVRECSRYIEDKFDFCGDEIIIAESVLKHFGVEE